MYCLVTEANRMSKQLAYGYHVTAVRPGVEPARDL